MIIYVNCKNDLSMFNLRKKKCFFRLHSLSHLYTLWQTTGNKNICCILVCPLARLSYRNHKKVKHCEYVIKYFSSFK